jgi:hypothetical protein
LSTTIKASAHCSAHSVISSAVNCDRFATKLQRRTWRRRKNKCKRLAPML